MVTRLPVALQFAVFLTLLLFWALWQAVSRPVAFAPAYEIRPILFTPQLADTPVEPKPRTPPVRLPTPEIPALPSVAHSPGGGGESWTAQPRVELPPTPRLQAGGSDGLPLPLVRIPPEYPAAAARRGTEGWVKVEFTVGTSGAVQDARVVDAHPPRVFDAAALEAISRWRYRPGVAGGEPVEQVGLQTVIRFDLED